ncbi:MAG: MarR family winged helix-turn-helix transcriptional regulator [Deltaproteobacteria bacterium]
MNIQSSSEELQIIGLIKNINHILKNEMLKASKKHGITPTQVMVIKYIWINELVTLSSVSAGIGLSMSTTSGIVDRLVKGDFVKAERSEKDRRTVNLTLTQKTKDLGERIKEAHEIFIEKVFNKVSDTEKNQLKEILKKFYIVLTENIEQ